MDKTLTILIPSRNEEFLKNTIDDILSNIEGETEIIAVLDGQWANPPLKQHPRLTVIYLPESIGQRATTNLACLLSKSKYVMKVDAHCSFDKGFDRKLMEDMQDDWTQVPIMRNLHCFDWVCEEGHRRYQSPSGVCEQCKKETKKEIVWIAKPSPQSTSYRFDNDLHFQYYGEYKKEQIGDLVETMSLQGSCFMMTREKYWGLNICDESWGSWGNQGTEVACKTWLSGGRVIVNKKTWYAHMFRTQGGDFGFPYPQSGNQVEHARQCSRDLFLNNKYDKAIYPFSWLINKFNPPDWKREIIYYTDNRLNIKIAKKCQKRLESFGLPITSVSLKPMTFGKNIVLKGKRSPEMMFKQILAGLEASTANIVFLAEHDVLYDKSHFDFIPPRKDKFYFNVNVIKVDWETGKGVKVDDCKQNSGLCAYRNLLIDWIKTKIDNFDGHYEPQDNRESWSSENQNIDIRHENNLTPTRWNKEEFRNQKYTKGWKEYDSIRI